MNEIITHAEALEQTAFLKKFQIFSAQILRAPNCRSCVVPQIPEYDPWHDPKKKQNKKNKKKNITQPTGKENQAFTCTSVYFHQKQN